MPRRLPRNAVSTWLITDHLQLIQVMARMRLHNATSRIPPINQTHGLVEWRPHMSQLRFARERAALSRMLSGVVHISR